MLLAMTSPSVPLRGDEMPVRVDGVVVPDNSAIAAIAKTMIDAGGRDASDRWGAGLRLAGDARAELVRRGLAYAAPSRLAEDPTGADLLAIEAEARAAGRGLWTDPALAVQDARSVAAEPFRFAVVEGVVVAFAEQRMHTYINFGADRRRDFTARADAAIWRRLEQSLPLADDMVGRRVRVRGWIIERGGPMIVLEDPMQLEIIE